MEHLDPHIHNFPLEAMSACQYARFTPRVWLSAAFPDNERITHDHALTSAVAMSDAPDNRVFEDVDAEIPSRHGQAHDPNSFFSSNGSAKEVDGSPKGNGLEQGRQDPEAAGVWALLWRTVKRCSKLTRMA